MRRFTMLALPLAASLLAGPGASSAATFGGEVFGAYNSHAMDDVNDAIAVDNSNGASFDDLNGGLTGGLGLRLWATPTWMFSAVWEPLFLETESDNARWNMDGNSFQFSGGYFFPTTGHAKYGLGAGVGFYTVNGENEDPSQIPTTFAVEGSGVGFHVMGLAEWTVSPGFGVTAGAGYRAADIEIDESTNGSTVDYGGFLGRVGLAFYFPAQ